MMQVYVGWYNHCHGPGSNDGFREWDMFCRFLLGMIGYDETAMTCLLKVVGESTFILLDVMSLSFSFKHRYYITQFTEVL